MKNVKGASCENCAHKCGDKPKACYRCRNQNGRPGWEPGAEISVQETRGWIFNKLGNPIETIFKRVVM